ncbi:DegT/DnrJ/EryC1/StrS family aminotransferase [Candidatus Gracilibacteria bacterium]|nr:DegT/DnrJ/EryC1/StrS family aminotransferase [Candidatus Gracilibacteria bacterium]
MLNILKINWPGIGTKFTKFEIKKINDVILKADTYSMGKYLIEFENNFKKYHKIEFCVGLSSCTAALEIAALLSNLNKGDEVIVPAHTFSASAIPFARTGAKLVFADIDQETFLVSLKTISTKLTDKTKAVIIPHLYGLMAPVREIFEYIKKINKNILIIEDCAQSIGAEANSLLAGTIGDFACYSFHSQKNINSLGEGGMLVVKNKKIFEATLRLRKIGSRPFKNQKNYWQPAMSNILQAIPGIWPYNFALSEIQAFAGNIMFSRLDEIIEKRTQNAEEIKKKLINIECLKFQKIPVNYKHSYHLLPFRVNYEKKINRNDIIKILFYNYGIKCAVQYMPLYRYDLFKKFGYINRTCIESDKFFDNMISIPFWTEMKKSDIKYITNSIEKTILQLRR